MAWHRFDRASLPATPWKNGGGMTREIVCQPMGASLDAFDWRVSIAHIASDGPFSAFRGVDRVITLLEGGGVHLQSDDGSIDHRLDQPLVPFAFAGEAAVHARLLAGACDDFNVMTRRATCRARVDVLRGTARLAAPQGLLMALRGQWQVTAQGRDTEGLQAGHGLCWKDATDWQLQTRSPDAALLAVTIHPIDSAVP